MSETCQLNIRVSPAIKDATDRMARDLGLSRAAVVRRALGCLEVLEQARRDGAYVGVTRERECLDTVIVVPA
jgi:predicted transcriptional regulator